MKNKRKASSSSGGAVSSPQRPPTANVSDAPISGPQFLPGMSVPSSMSATGTVTTAPPNPTLPAPGTEDVLEALEHNINFLADTMANQGQNTDADLARLHALRSTLQQTKDLHAQNERQRIDTFLTMSAVQANGAIPQLTAQQQAMASLNGVNLPQSQLDNSLPNASADVSSNNVGGGDGTAALTDTDGTAIADTDNSANAKNADTDITGTNDSIVADAGATKNNTKKAYTQPKLDPELEKMLQPTGFLDCPAMSPEEEERELKSLSEADYYKAYADIYGRKPTPLAQVEQMLIDVDMELSRLPREDAAAINAARDALPLLCLSSRHIMLFLQNEDFVPRRAALRMARFWTERIDLYGDAAFNITSNISLPTEDDLLRMYNRSYDVVECRDPAVREENRAMARAFLDRFEGCMIEAIRNEIHTYPDSKKESYLKALKSCPHRVEELYLDFLRCTNFSIKSSAERMINYFHFYDKLFGPSASDNLVGEFLPISQMTMGDRAIEDLELGFCRLVPNANDDHGRPIMFFDFSYLEEGSYTMMGALKSVFYVANVLAQDENTLKNGVVLIESHRNCEPQHYNFQLLKQAVSLLSYCLPIQIKVTHSLRPIDGMPEWQTHITKKLEYLAGRVSRFRVVPHCCTLEDFVNTAEDAYGISREILPKEIGGDATLDSWREWLSIRADLEDMGEVE